MQRLLVLTLIALGLVATAASWPATQVSAANPILVVFPFSQNDGVPEGTGQAVVDRVAAEITALGGITIVKGDPATKPADFRKVARDAGAELYYSGTIAPVGGGFSAIENLVSTSAGLVRWSVTMQFHTVSDIRGEGARVRDQIMHTATPLPFPSQNPV